MAVFELSDETTSTFADGASFGDVGPYELVRAKADVALDPTHPVNARITDVDRAVRSPDGRVHLRSTMMVLRPVDRARANQGLLAVVPNRGNTGGLPFAV